MIPRCAEMLEQDLGVKIEPHDWLLAGDHSSRLLERLRANSELRKDLREARVITFEIPWNAIESPWWTFESGSSGACGGVDNQDRLREAFETYVADRDEIIAEIVSLRGPSEALIRTQDTCQFQVREARASGTFEIISGYWREANAHVIEGATVSAGEKGRDDRCGPTRSQARSATTSAQENTT